MKYAVIIGLALLVGCGGGGTVTPTIEAPTIATIGGTGTGGEVLDTLVVTGTNFDDSCDVFLSSDNSTVALAFTCDSDTQLKATLPTDIAPGDYDLVIENDAGKADAPLSLLQGPQGIQGTQGPQGPAGVDGQDGADGITVVHAYSCGLSNDFDPDVNASLKGLTTQVWEFSDGSYFIFCMIDYYDPTVTDSDSSSAVMFIPSSAASGMGEVRCIALYATARYFIDTNTVRYEENGDPTHYADVACSTTY